MRGGSDISWTREPPPSVPRPPDNIDHIKQRTLINLFCIARGQFATLLYGRPIVVDPTPRYKEIKKLAVYFMSCKRAVGVNRKKSANERVKYRRGARSRAGRGTL